MARAIWKGSISFGLVHIPVGLFAAEERDELSFRQLDRRNMSPIGYKKYNKATGKDVSMDEIVRGYEYEPGQYVVVSDEDFKRANPEATQTVEITDFVDAAEITPAYYDKPYYLGPLNARGAKSYALLRETLRRSGKVGISTVVIRSRQHLAAVIPVGDVLVLELLRYPDEIRRPDDLDLPSSDLKEAGVTAKELEMAEKLVEGMTEAWDPTRYHDSYREDLMALIERKARAGDVEEAAPVDEEKPRTDVIDIMTLLKRSVAEAGKRGKAAPEKPAAKAASGSRSSSSSSAKPKRPKSAEPAKPARRTRKSA